jgi:hypothetical protein
MAPRLCALAGLALFSVSCTLNRAKSAQYKWGQSAKTVETNEYQRLDAAPIERQSFPKSDISTLVYADRMLKASCFLTYWFDMDSLQAVSYSCSNPDWSEEELKSAVGRQLASVYGEPVPVVKGKKRYDYYPDKNNHTYFRLVRIAQDKEFWRTFQANVVISHYSHTDYPLLAELLLKLGRD